MQQIFQIQPSELKNIKKSLSEARLTRYIKDAGGDPVKAMHLYSWNTLLSQSLYSTMQTWEVTLRNHVNGLLCWKYTKSWPFGAKNFLRQLRKSDRERVDEAVARIAKNGKAVPPDAVFADLSLGFWVSMLGARYEVTLAMRPNGNIGRVFPLRPRMDRQDASDKCDKLLALRNRIAHHEPIYHMPLDERRDDANDLLSAMCPVMHRFSMSSCTFKEVWAARPKMK